MATVATQVYSFTMILSGVSELTPAMAESLFAAGCDDATPASRGGIVHIAFDRDAESLGDAVGSAIRDVERAGFKVAQVEVESAGESS
ncbi:hypothetical protein [Tautonia marina]|uniref:hypothetical protein n=1 Tax=Tautonia marina TaxID=2653855 RepID=UPI0012610060|nr:hypothetical protein [Tautonia marina]